MSAFSLIPYFLVREVNSTLWSNFHGPVFQLQIFRKPLFLQPPFQSKVKMLNQLESNYRKKFTFQAILFIIVSDIPSSKLKSSLLAIADDYILNPYESDYCK